MGEEGDDRPMSVPGRDRRKTVKYDWLRGGAKQQTQKNRYTKAIDGADMPRANEYSKQPSFAFGKDERFSDRIYIPHKPVVRSGTTPGPIYELPESIGQARLLVDSRRCLNAMYCARPTSSAAIVSNLVAFAATGSCLLVPQSERSHAPRCETCREGETTRPRCESSNPPYPFSSVREVFPLRICVFDKSGAYNIRLEHRVEALLSEAESSMMMENSLVQAVDEEGNPILVDQGLGKSSTLSQVKAASIRPHPADVVFGSRAVPRCVVCCR
jgi:hypothetical protein